MDLLELGMVAKSTGWIKVEGVAKAYRQKDTPPTPVLENCAFEVEPGKLTVLMGPSGCGKSTLAYMIAGYISPDRGTLTIDGIPIKGPGPDRIMVFQETALWPWMTVMENVTFGPAAHSSLSRIEARKRADALLKKFGLSEFKDKYPGQLSGGMKRRAELAQALINNPKAMILDEPFRGLDVMTRELMQEYYIGLFEEIHLTTLFITSELEEAIFLADRVLLLGGTPSRVVKTLEVGLPHPRRFEILTSERYLEIKKELMEELYRDQSNCAAMSNDARMEQTA
jgi:NitT/TauT family transport system ATP-binding protein